MTDKEFLDKFDVLYNNIASNQAPGLNVYEVCVFLTKAQDEKIKNYFNPKGNKYEEGFDDNQKRQIDFSMITRVHNVSSFSVANYDPRDNSKSVALPTDAMMIINERTTVTREGNSVELVVKPVSYDEYDRLMTKPFKRPVRNQAWRIISGDTAKTADLVVGPGDVITGYSVRYIRRPKPIIVGDLDGLTLDGYTYGTGDNQAKGCELDPSLHEEILQRAIELAKIAWTATGNDNTQAVVQAGQRSE